jgi:hypothetical protein
VEASFYIGNHHVFDGKTNVGMGIVNHKLLCILPQNVKTTF